MSAPEQVKPVYATEAIPPVDGYRDHMPTLMVEEVASDYAGRVFRLRVGHTNPEDDPFLTECDGEITLIMAQLRGLRDALTEALGES